MTVEELIHVIKNRDQIFARIDQEEDYFYAQLFRMRKIESVFTPNNTLAEECSVYRMVQQREDDLVTKLQELSSERHLIEVILNVYRNLDRKKGMILHYLYLEERSWDWISIEMDISKTSISRYRASALQEMQEQLANILP